MYAGSNGNSNPPLYVRKLVSPWVEAGTLTDYGDGSLRKKYPDEEYELGYSYNGDIQGAFLWVLCFPSPPTLPPQTLLRPPASLTRYLWSPLSSLGSLVGISLYIPLYVITSHTHTC